MGEMLENIAHQWRQPLSIISVAATGIKMRKECDLLTDEELLKSIDSINSSAQYLSKTIDDFRNFYSDDKLSSEFYLDKTIDKTLDLFSVPFNANNIFVTRKIQRIKVNSIENELIQVLINIINNAQDALKGIDKNKLLFIDCFKDGHNAVIKIKDNANGIPEEIIDNIFEPYFTTKHKSQGTGIGLYMSEQIISKHMSGIIEVENKVYFYEDTEYKGACFTIIIPLLTSEN